MLKNNGKIILPQKRLTLRETQMLYSSTLQSLKNMSIRVQMLGCELQRVDKRNDIFKMSEGVLDKEHLYIFRKALNDGQYDRNREIARDAFN